MPAPRPHPHPERHPPAARARRRTPVLAPGLAALALLTGCGTERATAPDVATPATPDGTAPQRFETAGLSFAAPGGWAVRRGTPPLVATLSSGRAVLSVFRYPRTEPLPRSRRDLDDAAEALEGAAKQRDPTFTELKRGRLRVDGRPGVVLRGTQTVAGELRTVRSTHVYAFGGEVVVDAFAPARDFERVDAEAFRPLVRSIELERPAG